MEPIFATATKTYPVQNVQNVQKWERNADKLGVFASIACAIHCVLTPFFLLLLPTFGKFWAHPASHWGMALLVVPIAALMMSKGYARHRRKWIMAIGFSGILLVVAGAFAPYFDKSSNGAALGNHLSSASLTEESCTDSCCPTVHTMEAGGWNLHIPMASILTTAGGLLLIFTHATHLCRCSSCRKDKKSPPGTHRVVVK